MSGAGFDRLRRRAGGAAPGGVPPVGVPRWPADAEGKRALFSPTDARPAAGSVTVDCSGCGARSSLTVSQAARALLPSVHLPLLRRYPSLVRCPACRRRTWCRLRLRL